MNNVIIANFVKDKRTIAKLTQIQLAKKAGVGLRFIRELEAGKITVRVEVVNKVLKIFGAVLAPVKLKEIINNE